MRAERKLRLLLPLELSRLSNVMDSKPSRLLLWTSNLRPFLSTVCPPLAIIFEITHLRLTNSHHSTSSTIVMPLLGTCRTRPIGPTAFIVTSTATFYPKNTARSIARNVRAGTASDLRRDSDSFSRVQVVCQPNVRTTRRLRMLPTYIDPPAPQCHEPTNCTSSSESPTAPILPTPSF